MESISNMWMSLSSMYIAMDMSFGIVCGVGLFLLLIPFLKKCPVSPPPESKKHIPKDVKRGHSNTRKKAAAGKDYRNSRKNVQDTQNASPPMESPAKHLPLDSTAQPYWNSNEKLDQLPMFHLLSYLKILEQLIQQKFSQIFWGISSVLPEPVVATAWVSRKPPSIETKTSPFSKSYSPFPALPLFQGPPQLSKAQPLHHQLVTPSWVDVTETQVLKRHPSSTPKNRPSSKSRAHETTYSNPRMKVLTSIPTENKFQQKSLKWKDVIGSTIVPKRQEVIRQSADSLPWGTLLTEAIRSASILPEHCRMLRDHERQKKHRATKVGDYQDLCFGEPMNPAGHFPTYSPHQSKNGLELSQTTQPSILDSKTYKSSHIMESVPSRLPLKKRPVKPDSIKEDLLPCTPSSITGKRLEPRKPAPRMDQQSYVNTAQELPFLDSKTQMKLESNITQLPMKCRKSPYLQGLESRDLIQSGAPASYLPQPVYPSSATCVSKAEHCPKTAVIPEKLHHQDPGGTRLKIASATRLQNTLPAYSSSEVQETQRTSSPAASHGPSEADEAATQNTLNTWANAYCLLARTQESRTIRGTGRGSLQPRATSRIVRQEPWKSFENVASGHPFWRSTTVDPGVRTPPSVAKQTNRIVEVRKETPPPWKETLGPSKIPGDQNININPRVFESARANVNPGHFQTCQLHSRDPPLKPQVISMADVTSDKLPLTSTARLLADRQSTMHPATVIWPFQDSLPRYQNTSKEPKTSEGLHNVPMRKNHSQETQNLRVPKDKVLGSSHKMFYPNEEKGDFMRFRAKSQGERLEGVQSSQGYDTSTQPKDTGIPESQSDMPGNEQDIVVSLLRKIKRNLQYLNLDTKNKEQWESIKNESPPPSTLQSQIKGKSTYSKATEAQPLLNVVVQILANTLGLEIKDLSKVQWHEVEQLLSQLGVSSHSSERVYDPKTSQQRKRMSCDYTSPKVNKHPFMCRRPGDKQELSVNAQRAQDQHQNRVKRGMGFDQLSTRTEQNQLFRYWENGDKQQPSLAAQRACYPDQNRTRTGKEPCPQNNPKRNDLSFRYREIGNKQQPGVDYKAFDTHQSTKKEMGCGHLTSTKKNHPIKYRETRPEAVRH
ncbi:spermatogenesis-associated protein 31E1-like [Arvicanthis niloticus]|uniref:spermatogenesis-associated protein 31E1-like n=1 Tax=Arvicanthis niloticus TaxID=61156 RepID=UPI0014864C1B|nr:spermatogenesis-associated protein 31-like [Arvicanthis niloticus]